MIIASARAAASPSVGPLARQIPAAAPRGIGFDGHPLHGVPGDGLGGRGGRRRKHDQPIDRHRGPAAPLERHHAAERAAGDERQPIHAELREQRGVRERQIRRRQVGKRLVVLARPLPRAGGPVTAPEQVGCDDGMAGGVQRLARPDERAPPAPPRPRSPSGRGRRGSSRDPGRPRYRPARDSEGAGLGGPGHPPS